MMNTDGFIQRIKNINWFENSGKVNNKYHVVYSLFEAYDNWNESMLNTWEPAICFLEKKALETIGDEEIDKIFNIVSNNISDKLWNRYCLFIDRCQLESENGLTSEILDFIKRDISWACIEYLLNINGLFSNLLGIYEEGYFPCSWIGKYPSGKPVVV